MNGETIKGIFKQIECKVDEGERLLADVKLRTQIEFSLEAYFAVANKQLSPRGFMIELTFALFRSLTNSPHLTRLEEIGALLKPLKEIKDIGCGEHFNSVVAVNEDGRIKDVRMTLEEFRDGLREYLNRDKSAEKNPASRRIEGFAPRPRDDERHEPKG